MKDKVSTFVDLMTSDTKKEVTKLLHLLRVARDEKRGEDQEESERLLKAVGVDPINLAFSILRNDIPIPGSSSVDFGLRKIPISVTTIASAKGLAEDFVFITHFDDRFFIRDQDKNQLKDQDICSFLVALTRARRQVFLISSDRSQDPTFLKWISRERVTIVR